MKTACTYLIILLVTACLVGPVLADDGNITNTTAVPTVNETPIVTTAVTTAVPVTTTAVTMNATTAAPTTTITTVPSTTVTTVTTATTAATGNVFVASSPPGAAILVDAVYYGTTPGKVNGLSPGNHLIRLSLSGYNDYEGTIYVIAGGETSEYGTLHPMNTIPSPTTATSQPTTAPLEITSQPTVTPASSSESAFQSPTVIAALIGILTAAIGAGATIFTHNAKVKSTTAEEKERKDGKE